MLSLVTCLNYKLFDNFGFAFNENQPGTHRGLLHQIASAINSLLDFKFRVQCSETAVSVRN